MSNASPGRCRVFQQRDLPRCDFTGGKGEVGDTIKQQLGRGECSAVEETIIFWAALGSALPWLAWLPSWALLTPADVQTKGGTGEGNPTQLLGAALGSLCQGWGCALIKTPLRWPSCPLPVATAQHLDMFGCPAMLTASESCPGTALAPCRGTGGHQHSQRTLTLRKGGHPTGFPFSLISRFILYPPVWLLYLSPTSCVPYKVTLHPMHG